MPYGLKSQISSPKQSPKTSKSSKKYPNLHKTGSIKIEKQVVAPRIDALAASPGGLPQPLRHDTQEIPARD